MNWLIILSAVLPTAMLIAYVVLNKSYERELKLGLLKLLKEAENLRKQVQTLQQDQNSLRTIFMSYKVSWDKDLKEVQMESFKIQESQKRVSKTLRKILAEHEYKFEIDNLPKIDSKLVKKVKKQIKELSV